MLTLETPEGVVETLRVIRAEPRHRNFIISTWVKSYEAQARKQGIAAAYATSEPAIAETRWSDCWVLTDDDGYTVYGWVCGDSGPGPLAGSLWHVYVIPALRRMRVGTRLIEHACRGLAWYARPWPYSAHARVNPYLLCKKTETEGKTEGKTETERKTEDTNGD